MENTQRREAYTLAKGDKEQLFGKKVIGSTLGTSCE